MEGFEVFDWEGDEGWQAHLCRLEVPDPAMLVRAKQKWYKREIDPDFDASTGSKGQPAASPPPTGPREDPAPTAEPAGGTASEPAAGHSPSAQPQWASPAASARGLAAKLGALLQQMFHQAGSPQRLLFWQHVALLALFLVYMQPLNRELSHSSYLLFLLVAITSYMAKVFLKFGAPSLKPFPSAPKAWLVQAAATTELQYAIICSLFLSSRPILLVCIPTLVLAVFHANAYATAHLSHTQLWQQYGRPANALLTSKQRDAQLYNAGAEIALGFLVLVKLFTRERNFMQAILYWQLLRLRYHTPDCAAYHRQVWRMAGQAAQPAFQAVPALRTPISFVQRWFINAGR